MCSRFPLISSGIRNGRISYAFRFRYSFMPCYLRLQSYQSTLYYEFRYLFISSSENRRFSLYSQLFNFGATLIHIFWNLCFLMYYRSFLRYSSNWMTRIVYYISNLSSKSIYYYFLMFITSYFSFLYYSLLNFLTYKYYYLLTTKKIYS